MRILVDYRPALRARTGVGEYMHELTRAYAAAHDDEVAVFTSSWRDRPDPAVAVELGVRIVDARVPVRVLNGLWHRAAWPPVEWFAGPIDVVHAAHPLLIPARHAAQVVTIHDLFFLDHPERTRAEIRRDYPALTARHARRADAIVTLAEHGKRLIVERFGVEPSRIYVCSPGAPAWRHLGSAPHTPADGYVLFIGTLEPRKNIGTLLDAYERLIARRPDVPRLVLVGGAAPDARAWLDRIERPPLAGHVEYRGYVPDDQREAIFAGARLLVLPSLDEGFGIPAVEAMAAGIPVIVANRGALPEVVGEAGVLVDALDAEAWANAIERMITDPSWARGRACAGIERARRFTWAGAARTLHRAYADAHRRRSTR